MEKIDKLTKIKILVTDEGGADVLQRIPRSSTYRISGIAQGSNDYA